MIRVFLTLQFSLLFLLFFLNGNAQTLPPKITTYTPEQYDAHGQIFSSELLPSGRRAFGTSSEVLVHDGESFSRVKVGSGKVAVSMDRDRAGRLFVGGKFLMGVIAPDSTGTLSFSSLQSLLPDSLRDFGMIWNTLCDGEGGVYFRTSAHLFYYAGDSVRVVRPEKQFSTMDQPSGRLVVQDLNTGLFAISDTGKEYLPGSDSLFKGKKVMAILPAPGDGDTWTVLTGKHGLYRYDPSTGRVGRFEGDDGEEPRRALREAGVYTAARLDPGANPYGAAYAVGTRLNGLYLLGPEGAILLQLGREAGIPAKLILQVRADEAGNIWAGTNNGIALVHTGLPFTVAGEGGFFSGKAYDISQGAAPDRGGVHDPTPFFLATSQGVWKWTGEEGGFSILPGSEGACYDLHPRNSPGERPRMLIGGSNSGLLSTSALPGRPFPADTLNGHQVYDITDVPTPRGRGVLFGGRGGLHVLVPTEERAPSWKALLSVEEVPGEIRSVGWAVKEGDPDSLAFWAGMSSKGLLRVMTDTAFSGHQLTRYDTADGLPEGEVWIFPDPSTEGGGVLFGTEEGLYVFEDGKFVPSCRYGRIFCDSSRQVFRLEKGVDGELWIQDFTGGQVKHLVPQGEGYRIDSTVFRAMELGTVRTIFPEEERTWLGGDQGLACYFPELEVDPGREWDCRVSEVRGSGDSLLFGGTFGKKVGSRQEAVGSEKDSIGGRFPGRVPVEDQPDGMIPVLPYSENRMAFNFAAAFPTRQEVVAYSYKLAGFDTAWSKWTDEPKKEYTNLPEGAYTFRVKARNIYLKESSTAEYRFRILPPWYRTWSAYGGYSLAGIGLIWLIVWLNSRRLLAQKERLERTVEERTKEIQEKNEALAEEKKEVEKANETITKQKEKVEEQQKETEKQKMEVEEQKEKVEEAHQEITQSIDYAQKIQYALLQSEEHVSLHLPEHFILFKPYSQVSGDFYWAKEHKGYFYIAAIDCTGHGVPGAFMSMLGISQLNEIMNTDEVLTPGYILTDLRDRLVRELSGSDPESAAKDGMDAALVKIPIPRSQTPNDEKIEVEFAGAQNPLYVIRKGIGEKGAFPKFRTLEKLSEGTTNEGNDRLRPFKKSSNGIEVKGDSQPVGHDEYAKDAFTTVSLKLQKGDMLYFFSDGYADQFGGPKGKKFRYRPFKELLSGIHEKELEEQKQELDKTFEDWKDESQQEQIDDVVVIGVRL